MQRLILLFITIVGLFSCQGPSSPPLHPGNPMGFPVEISLNLSEGGGTRSLATDVGVVSVEITVLSSTGAVITSGTLTKQLGIWKGVLTLNQTGLFTFVARAMDSSEGVLWQGAASESVNGTTTITIATHAFSTSQIIAGGRHAAILDGSGQLWTWGDNSYRAIARGDNADGTIPGLVWGQTFVKVAAGVEHTLGIDSSGNLWVAGSGAYGQLGTGTTTTQANFVQISGTWLDAAAGDIHSLGIKSDGTLWGWGWNSSGQVGDNTSGTNRLSPVQIGTTVILESGESWAKVAAGRDFSFALTNQGRLYGWGSNSNNTLGFNEALVYSYLTPVRVGTDSDWDSISCGYYHTLARKTDLTLWGTGRNNNGQLGLANYSYNAFTQLLGGSTVKSFDAGDNHSLAIKTEGTLWVFGNNTRGQLGDGTITNKTIPLHIGSDTNWDSVVAGQDYSMARKTTGQVLTWGSSEKAQTGQGYSTLVLTPSLITSGVTKAFLKGSLFVLKSNGTLCASGSNSSGKLGLGHTNSPILELTQTATGLLDLGQTWTKVVQGSSTTLLLRSDGALFSSGDGYYGQVGQGNTTSISQFTRIGTATWQDVDLGSLHAAGIQSDGTLWTWGTDNYYSYTTGLLGQGTSPVSPCTSPLQVGTATDWLKVSCGDYFTSAVTTSGKIFTWGESGYFRLGNNDDLNDKNIPTQIHDGVAWQATSLGTSGMAAWVKTSSSNLYGWGYKYGYDQFGLGGNWSDLTIPTPFLLEYSLLEVVLEDFRSFALRSDGSLLIKENNGDLLNSTWKSGTLGATTFQKISFPGTWTDIDGHYESFVMVKDNGDLYGFGQNMDFQLSSAVPGHILSPREVKF